MSLLEEIQTSAVDADSDLATILRKLKLLAARLGSQPLEDWILWESNGYPPEAPVPDYRVWPLELKGHFSGPFGSGMNNAPISTRFVPENVRPQYERFECRQSIASIESTLNSSKKGTLTVPTGDLALYLGTKVYQHLNCLQAWGEFGSGHLVELLNSVRNRVLDLSIAIWKEAPEAGAQQPSSESSIEASRVTQIFNTTVYGGAANLVGAATASTVNFNISTNDFESLRRVLIDNGVSEPDITVLQTALEAEPTPQVGSFGPRVSSWIASMAQKAASGSWQIGLGAAGTLLATAIGKFYGLA